MLQRDWLREGLNKQFPQEQLANQKRSNVNIATPDANQTVRIASTPKGRPQELVALSSVRANIPTLALQAANELDDVLHQRRASSPTSKKLGELLLSAIRGSKRDGEPRTSVRSGTVAVFCHALHRSPYEQRVDNMEDFISVATNIGKELEAASSAQSEIEKLKQFCLALAKAAALYRPSAYSQSGRLPRR